MKTIIDAFEIYTMNSLIEKKFHNEFHMSKASFGIAQPKQNKKYYYYYWRKY